jgi:hypothetical protein
MLRIVGALKPVTDAVRPPPFPTVPPGTKVLLGKGGSGRTAWAVWIEPLHGSGLLLSGLAPEQVAAVRIELAGRSPVTTPTFGTRARSAGPGGSG